ncbi:MAG: nitroreductase family protein [Oscillospiraceae bacterium]|jgi:nitroreductase|nr:nitroreductase family protein [Oscillospiraceae bacterium]
MSDFLELAVARRSIRGFTGKDVPQEDLLKLLKAARSAPSGGNCQPWRFYVIRDKTVQAEIARASGGNAPFLLTAPVLIVVCADTARSESRYGKRGETLYCIQDTAAAIQNILLCAKDLGLGTCWCGAFDEDAVSKVLDLPKSLRPVAVIPVGVPANEPPVSADRRPLEEIVTYIGESGILSHDEEPHRKIEHVNMGGAQFRDVNLYGSTFNDADMRNVEISDVNLSDGRIHSCNLTNVTICDCKLDGMTINGKDVTGFMEN